MKVRYFVVKGKNQFTPIYMRFWNGRIFDTKAKTGLTVDFNNWNNTKQKVKPKANAQNRDFINNHLEALRTYTIEQYNKDYNSGTYIGKNWLKDCVNKYFGRVSSVNVVYFTDWIEKYISNPENHLHKGKPLTYRTIQKHKTTLLKLKEFEAVKNTRLRFQEIDLNFYKSFLAYCRNVERLRDNSIGKYIADIKKFCKLIELDGFPISQQYKHSDFVAVTNETKDVYLNEAEINAIFKYDFSHSERLENARDLFIIGLRTGLRVSDFLQLKDTNISNDLITIKTKKTNKEVVIGMHPQIKAVLNKRNGVLPRSISGQRFNLYIKEICEKVGINELVNGAKMNPETKRKENGIFPKYELISSHTCRRSFASNLYGKVPIKSIMAVTGHQTETQFLNYIKITPKEHAERVLKHWEHEAENKGLNTLRIAK